MNPRVVTGVGVVSALGVGRDPFFAALRAGTRTSQEARVESFDASKYPRARVAEVRDFDAAQYLGARGMRTLDRLSKLLVVAARQCLHDAALKTGGQWVEAPSGESPWATRVGLVVSNAYGSLEAITELDRVALLEDPRYINPSRFPLTVSNTAAGYVSIWEDLRALNVSVSDGNCGALDAVACADIYLETGRADVLLVGGAEALSEGLFLAFHRLGALGAGTDGSGTLGEGSALFVMEPLEHAAARGATVLAEIVGYGTAFLPPPGEALLFRASAEALERAIASALADAGAVAADVDVVASSVSGMHAFDDEELAAIGRAVGPAVAVAAPKAIFGETLGAGGAMGMAAIIAWMGGATPTPLVRGLPPARVRTALVTSMGFYGNASAVVMRSRS